MRRRALHPLRAGRAAVRSVGVALTVAACDDGLSERQAALLVRGDPAHGRAVIRQYGCGSCHTIAGVPGANSLVGPPLNAIAARAYIAGVLPNTPENLVRWIEDPKAVDSKTAMPNLGVSEQDARDIASYLYSLR